MPESHAWDLKTLISCLNLTFCSLYLTHFSKLCELKLTYERLCLKKKSATPWHSLLIVSYFFVIRSIHSRMSSSASVFTLSSKQSVIHVYYNLSIIWMPNLSWFLLLVFNITANNVLNSLFHFLNIFKWLYQILKSL